MRSQVVSFRFNAEEITVLENERQGDESLNQTAARLLRERLGLNLEGVDKVSTSSRQSDEERMNIVLGKANDFLSQAYQQLFEEKTQELQNQIDELRKLVEESQENATSKRRKSGTSTVKKPTKSDSEVIQ